MAVRVACFLSNSGCFAGGTKQYLSLGSVSLEYCEALKKSKSNI